MAEPAANDIHVDASLKEVNRGRVAKDVWRYPSLSVG